MAQSHRSSRSGSSSLSRKPAQAGGSGQSLGSDRQYQNLVYKSNYISKEQKRQILDYLSTLHPIWEMRFSKNNPPPEGQGQRRLLRPVYWLGNWQFACLNYYHPPKGILNRCMSAEPYPDVLKDIVDDIESTVKHSFDPRDIPRGWHLNTCLINFYGDQISETKSESGSDQSADETDAKEKRIDCARVGEHKDFEPGPVASVSFGDRALFQFVDSKGSHLQSEVVLQQWLDDSSLQIFGGEKFKKKLFHRVQRVEKKMSDNFRLQMPASDTQFETRRINFTFRYVPDEHIVPFFKLSEEAQSDTIEYLKELAKNSKFFEKHLNFYLERKP